MPSIHLAVVILNWNGLPVLKQFLPSVIAHTPNARIFVADNGSTDGSVAWLNQFSNTITIIELKENFGFCKGYNLALAQIDATFVILLNSDIQVEAGWAQGLIGQLENNAKIGACQPKILDYADKQRFEYAGACGGFIDWLGYPFCCGRLFDTIEYDKGQYDYSKQIFWASGACLAIRMDAFWQVGGLEERFFAHMEEIDLCWRLGQAGYQIWNFPEVKVWHVGGATLHKSSPLKTFLNFRNGLAMLYKNYSGKHLGLTVLLRMVLDGVAGVRLLVGGKPVHTWAIVRAHVSFYTNLRYWKAKRKQGITQAKNNNKVGIYPKSIVKAYFLDKKQTFDSLDM